MNVVVGAGATAVLLLFAVVALIWKTLSSTRVRGVDPDWLREFSVSSYRPMERLLSEDDIAFLKAQPGFRPGMERDLRANRCRAFRMYLRNLARDFNRLHYALRMMVVHAPEDAADLARVLVRQKIAFFSAWLLARLRLELYAWGVGTVDVSGLLTAIENARATLSSVLRPVPVKLTAHS